MITAYSFHKVKKIVCFGRISVKYCQETAAKHHDSTAPTKYEDYSTNCEQIYRIYIKCLQNNSCCEALARRGLCVANLLISRRGFVTFFQRQNIRMKCWSWRRGCDVVGRVEFFVVLYVVVLLKVDQIQTVCGLVIYFVSC